MERTEQMTNDQTLTELAGLAWSQLKKEVHAVFYAPLKFQSPITLRLPIKVIKPEYLEEQSFPKTKTKVQAKPETEIVIPPLNAGTLTYKYKGELLTPKEIAERVDLPETLIYNRLHAGWCMRDATTLPKGAHRPRKRANNKQRTRGIYEYKGKKKSLSELSKMSGLTAGTINRRIKRNWTVEDAVDTPKLGGDNSVVSGHKKAARYSYDGKDMTLKEISKIVGISAGVIYSRLKLGWSMQKATTQKVSTLSPSYLKSYTVDGKEMGVEQAAREYNIPQSTLRSRLQRGLSLEEAITEPKAVVKVKTYTYKGQEYTIKQLAELSGYKESTVRARLDRNWSVEDAISSPINPTSFTPIDQFTKKYAYEGSMRNLSELVGFVVDKRVTKATLKNRLDKGWSVVDALSLPISTLNQSNLL